MNAHTTASAQRIDPEVLLTHLLHQTEALVLAIKEGLARIRDTTFRVPGEVEDPSLHNKAYRKDGIANGPLSPVGEQVMLSLLKLGLTDEEVGLRMSVSPNGVGARRRKWGRKYAQKG